LVISRSAARIGRLLGISTAIFALTVTTASASPSPNGGGRTKDAGDEAAELMESTQQRDEMRTAPTGLVTPGAYQDAYRAYSKLSVTPGSAWSPVTNVAYNSDDPRYRDPGASNSGGGAGFVSGRVQAVVADAACIFAGGAMSGVSRSCDNGATWTPIADSLATQSVGNMSIAPDGALWLATGDGTTGSGTYVGAGVYRLAGPDKASFTPATKVGGPELDSQIIRRILVDAPNNRVFATGSRGLYWHALNSTTGTWTRALAPCAQGLATCTDVNENYRDIVNDVVVQPGTNGKVLVANVAWRSGAAYNGFYQSTDGGNSWAKINPGGAINPKDVGNATMQYSADGTQLYVVLESPAALNSGAASALAGVYVSRSGVAAGPYSQIANPSTLAQSGSAMRKQAIGPGYQPGVQAWYNQFIGVDPANAQHVYVGLEEVYESWDGGTSWKAIGRYWNFGLSCWSYMDSANTCDGNVMHSDQHTITFRPGTGGAPGTVLVGNDGGLYSRSMSPTASSWSSLTKSGKLNFLQYYSVAVGKSTTTKGVQVWGGLQDNGVSLLDPANGAMVSPYGGDGGGQLADPNNGCRTVGEYVYLTLQMTTNCGKADGSAASDNAIISIAPDDPNPRFTAPFGADQTDQNTWVAGGQYVWVNTKTWASTSGADWANVADSGAGHSITAIASRNHTVWAGWCGSCNPGSTFGRGLLTNAGGDYRQLPVPTGVPNRMITGVTPDPSNPNTAFVAFGGYSRTWTDGPGSDLSGVGHIWKVTVNGTDTKWTDVSGATLPDVPADNLLITAKGRVLLGTDLGMVETTLAGLRSGTPTWTRSVLPITVVSQVIEGPDGNLYAATFGRGIYKSAA
jgi:hypothetical protein